jgi:universal stress protein A
MNIIAPPPTSDAAATGSLDGDVFPVSAARASRSPEPLHFTRIVVPVDFSEHSLKAFQTALNFGQQFGAELILVHIVEQIVYPGDWMYPPIAMSDFASGKREEIAKQLKALTAGTGVSAREIVRLGRAWQEVVEIAKETKADLVVLATHGYTGLRHVLLGSVAEKIVRHAPCQVLTVRADDRDFS